MAEAKKKRSTSAKKGEKNTKAGKNQRANNKNGEVYGVVYMLLGVLFGITLFINSESILKRFADGMLRGVFGLGAYLVPVLLIIVGVMCISGRHKRLYPGRVGLFVIMCLSLFGIIHLIFSYVTTVGECNSAVSLADALAQSYSAGQRNLGFGAFTALYAYPLTVLVSRAGALAVFAAFIIIPSIVLFNLSLRDAGARVGKSVKKTGERVQTHIKEAAERIEQRREEAFAYSLSDGEEEYDDGYDGENDGEPEYEDEDIGDNGLEICEFRPKNRRRPTITEYTVPDTDEYTDKYTGECSADELDGDGGRDIEESDNNYGDDGRRGEIELPVLVDDAVDGEIEPPDGNEEIQQAEYTENSDQIDTTEQGRQYETPSFGLLNSPAPKKTGGIADHSEKIKMMESTLESFGITAWVENITVGPAITRYELSIQRGTRVSKILNLSDDIALSMAATGVRIEAPIPGKSAIGIEIANDTVSMVTLREVLESDTFRNHKSPVAVGLGKDITGAPIIADLSKMPHLLIAGQTGSGKSVCINSIITSLLFKSSPKEVKLILVDPKKVELNVYNGIPHLLTPVVCDPKKAAGALQFVVREMEKRYEIFAKKKVKEIGRYNELMAETNEEKMPRIVVIVDELNDLMLVARSEVEDSVMRIAQLARAAGIYLILATQRPSVNVITGVIKANIPSRIAFAVASTVDSKTILDAGGAEKLVGKGDMLFHLNGEGKPLRVQGAFIGEQEIEKVVEYIKAKNDEAKYIGEEQLVMRELKPNHGGSGERDTDDEEESGEDELFPAAVEFAIESGSISISALQRRFKIGYARAGRLIDAMELRNIVEASQGAKPRQVLMTREEFWAMYDERLD